MKNKLNKVLAYGSALGTALLVAPLMTLAAADTDVVGAATSTANVMSENVKAAVLATLPIVVPVGVLILVIFLAWRFGKRFLGSR